MTESAEWDTGPSSEWGLDGVIKWDSCPRVKWNGDLLSPFALQNHYATILPGTEIGAGHRMGRLVALLGLVLSSPAWAQSFSTEQRNVINHLAQVLATTKYCSQLASNDTAIAMLLVGYEIDIRKRQVVDELTSKVRQHFDALKATSPEIGCRVAYALYGPGGENVPGLLTRKR